MEKQTTMATKATVECDILASIGQAKLMVRDAPNMVLRQEARVLMDTLSFNAERGVSGNHSTLDKLGELAFKIYGGPSCG